MQQPMGCLVIGAGRIGLPISVSLALSGNKVTILEKDIEKISILKKGISPFYEESMAEPLKDLVESNKLHITNDVKEIRSNSVIISAIGTSVGEDGTPDLEVLDDLIDMIAPHFPRFGLLILKTTLPIGMTELIAAKLSKKTGFELDKELYVAFSPERIVEGRAMEELRTLPKIIGGVGPNSNAKAEQIIKTLGGEIITVKDSKTAELCKLLDNSYRMTRFGFSADVALVASENGINAYDAIDAANKGYDRNNIPYPSIGVSGYCLTKDPYYLDIGAKDIWKNRGFPSTWLTARMAADKQIEFAYDKIIQQFNGKIENKIIVIGGITYKENVDDTRLSHGRELLKMFENSGASVRIWDNMANESEIDGTKIFKDYNALKGADCLIITVPHEEFISWNNKKQGLEEMKNKFIFDGWGIITQEKERNIIILGTGR